MLQWTLFQTGSIKFVLNKNHINRIHPIPKDFIRQDRIQQQSIEVNGHDVLLVDLYAASNRDKTAPVAPNAEIIFVKQSPPLALLADQIKGELETTNEQLDELPSVFNGTARTFFPKVLCLQQDVALVINADALVDLAKNAKTMKVRPSRQNHPVDIDKDENYIEEKTTRLNSSNSLPESQTLEAYIYEKLQQLIEEKVRKAVLKTIAIKLNQ